MTAETKGDNENEYKTELNDWHMIKQMKKKKRAKSNLCS